MSDLLNFKVLRFIDKFVERYYYRYKDYRLSGGDRECLK